MTEPPRRPTPIRESLLGRDTEPRDGGPLLDAPPEARGGAGGWAVVALVGIGGLAALVVFLRMPAWRPPWQLEASEQVVQAVHRAMRALKALEEAVGDEAWRLSDPRAARSTQETLRRLERVRDLLEKGPPPAAPDPAPPA